MYAEIDRDLKRAEEMREPFWAEYEENLSADALKRVIDFQNGRNLPSKAKLIVEIRRWLKKPTATQKKTLTYGSKDELVAETIASRDQPTLELYMRWFAETDGAVADKVRGLFTRLGKSVDTPKWRGCGFLRTIAELANTPAI